MTSEPNVAAIAASNPFIYKISPRADWAAAVRAGVFTGAPIDIKDGYIHFSTATQAAETAAKHFRDQSDLILIAIDTASLGDALRWEPSRGGDLFPHLYAPLDVAHARDVYPLALSADGIPQIPTQILEGLTKC